MALREFGECFEFECQKRAMPYEMCTYEHVSMGVCCIQDAIDVPKTEYDKHQLLNNIEAWDCILGTGMNDQMFDLMEFRIYIAKWIVKY